MPSDRDIALKIIRRKIKVPLSTETEEEICSWILKVTNGEADKATARWKTTEALKKAGYWTDVLYGKEGERKKAVNTFKNNDLIVSTAVDSIWGSRNR